MLEIVVFGISCKLSPLFEMLNIIFLEKIRKYTYFNMSSADPPPSPPPPPHSILRVKIYEPVHNIAYKMACVPTKDTDHPANPRSLIRVFTVRYMIAKDPKRLHADSEDCAHIQFRWKCCAPTRTCVAQKCKHAVSIWVNSENPNYPVRR